MEQKVKDLRSELDQVVMEIGRVRAGGEGDLNALRERRQEIEIESSELQAENAYREKEASEAAKKAHEAAISETLGKYDQAEKAFVESFTPVQECLEKLAVVKRELDTAVETFLSGSNPLQILRSIWKELPPDKQAELQRHVWDVFNVTTPMIDTFELCDQVRSRLHLLAMSAGHLKPNKPKASSGPRPVGTKATRSDPVFIAPVEAKKRSDLNQKRAVAGYGARQNRNKPLIPEKHRGGATLS